MFKSTASPWHCRKRNWSYSKKPRKPIQFSSVAQSCRTLCDPMNCSMPGLPVHHQLPEFTQTHVHCGEGNGNPLQCSCLEDPMDGGAWWAAVHRVAGSQTRLSDFTFTFHFHALEKEMATHSIQCSCLENPRDGGAWWAAIYVVSQSRTRLKQLSNVFYFNQQFIQKHFKYF